VDEDQADNGGGGDKKCRWFQGSSCKATATATARLEGEHNGHCGFESDVMMWWEGRAVFRTRAGESELIMWEAQGWARESGGGGGRFGGLWQMRCRYYQCLQSVSAAAAAAAAAV